MTQPIESSVLQAIPDPQTIANRLGECLREAKILKQMLKVSKSAAEEKRWRRQDASRGLSHAG